MIARFPLIQVQTDVGWCAFFKLPSFAKLTSHSEHIYILGLLFGPIYEELWSIFWCRFNRPFCLYLWSQRLHFQGLVSLWILACSCMRNSDMHEYSQSPHVNVLLPYKWFFSLFLCLSSWYLSGKVCWHCLQGNGCSLKCHLLVWIMTSLLRQLGTE